MQLFYAPNIELELQLPEEEAQHCFKVLRKQIGNVINIIDGKGNFFTCEIIENHVKKNKLKIITVIREFEKRQKQIHLAIAPTKNLDRIEWMVEKATEIGVDKITFLICKHSERKQIKLDRLEKKVISAIKQSVKAYIPILADITPLEDFFVNCIHKTKLIAHLREDCLPIQNFINDTDICILIGPEGDFSQEEINLALQNGFQSVNLGKSRLRTETAGLVSCALLN